MGGQSTCLAPASGRRPTQRAVSDDLARRRRPHGDRHRRAPSATVIGPSATPKLSLRSRPIPDASTPPRFEARPRYDCDAAGQTSELARAGGGQHHQGRAEARLRYRRASHRIQPDAATRRAPEHRAREPEDPGRQRRRRDCSASRRGDPGAVARRCRELARAARRADRPGGAPCRNQHRSRSESQIVQRSGAAPDRPASDHRAGAHPRREGAFLSGHARYRRQQRASPFQAPAARTFSEPSSTASCPRPTCARCSANTATSRRRSWPASAQRPSCTRAVISRRPRNARCPICASRAEPTRAGPAASAGVGVRLLQRPSATPSRSRSHNTARRVSASAFSLYFSSFCVAVFGSASTNSTKRGTMK